MCLAQWPVWWLIAPCAVMGILWHEVDQNHRIFEVRPSPSRCASPSRLIGSAPAARQILWSFSIWLEAVAIPPQVAVMQTDGECENVNSHYVFSLGPQPSPPFRCRDRPLVFGAVAQQSPCSLC